MTIGKKASPGLFIVVFPFGTPCAKQRNLTPTLPRRYRPQGQRSGPDNPHRFWLIATRRGAEAEDRYGSVWEGVQLVE